MDQFSLGLMLWLGLSQFVPQLPIYEPSDFYYYDRQAQSQPLLMKNKVWLPDTIQAKKYVETLLFNPLTQQLSFYSYEKLNTPHKTGFIITSKSKARIFVLMNDLAREKISFEPVVQWKGTECIPVYEIIAKVKPFVTSERLIEKLVRLKAFKVLKVDELGNMTYKIFVENLVMPKNILAVANMLSEDTSWFSWARVIFEPIYAPVSGRMTVTQGNVDLGFKRTLEVVINVYKPTVKVRMDLLPKLGQNLYMPFPQKNEYWYDFDTPIIEEKENPDCTVITMKSSFRYLNYGTIKIPAMKVAYEDGEIKDSFSIQGVDYFNQPITSETTLNDLQLIKWNLPSQATLPVPTSSPHFFSFTKIGAGILVFSAVILIFAVLIGLLEKEQVGEDLPDNTDFKNIIEKLNNSSLLEWRSLYLEAERCLMVLLGINQPITSSHPSVFGTPAGFALTEIEKLYQPVSKPDMRALALNLHRAYLDRIEDV